MQPDRRLLPRIAPYPRFDIRPAVTEVFSGVKRMNPDLTVWSDRTIRSIGPALAGFPEEELETVPPLDFRSEATPVAYGTHASLGLYLDRWIVPVYTGIYFTNRIVVAL